MLQHFSSARSSNRMEIKEQIFMDCKQFKRRWKSWRRCRGGPEWSQFYVGQHTRRNWQEIGIFTLEESRLQYDLVQTFKIIRGFNKEDLTTWFTLVGGNPARITRDKSDPLNIVRQVARTEIRRHFFNNRVIDHWNSLPSSVSDPYHFDADPDPRIRFRDDGSGSEQIPIFFFLILSG